jgi:HEAT repeat protein
LLARLFLDARMKSMGISTLCGVALGLVAADPAALPASGQSFLNKPLSIWLAELGSKDARTRRNAAYALGKTGPGVFSAVPHLVKSLKDADAGVREAATCALGEVGYLSPHQTIPVLIELLANDPSAAVRRNAAMALGNLARPDQSADESFESAVRTALELALGDRDASVRQNACWALGRMGAGKARSSVAILCDALEDSDQLVRRDAAAALGGSGTAPEVQSQSWFPGSSKSRRLASAGFSSNPS